MIHKEIGTFGRDVRQGEALSGENFDSEAKPPVLVSRTSNALV